MRKFNIPYNFDSKLLTGLNILKINHELIQSIYLPPYEFDYPSIRKNDRMPDEKKHFEHIEMIQNQFPNKIELLLQQPNNNYLMKNDLLKKYLDKGITKFTVGTIKQAEIIKEILPDAKITGSITMHITKDKLELNQDEYLKYFNSFVLDFSYNRNIDKIYNLPKNFQYTLIINSTCNSKCSGNFHWFTSDYNNFDCPYKDKSTWSKTSIISPFDLSLFDPYISSYKIVERGYPTREILTTLLLYKDFKDFFPNISPDENLYKNI